MKYKCKISFSLYELLLIVDEEGSLSEYLKGIVGETTIRVQPEWADYDKQKQDENSGRKGRYQDDMSKIINKQRNLFDTVIFRYSIVYIRKHIVSGIDLAPSWTIKKHLKPFYLPSQRIGFIVPGGTILSIYRQCSIIIVIVYYPYLL